MFRWIACLAFCAVLAAVLLCRAPSRAQEPEITPRPTPTEVEPAVAVLRSGASLKVSSWIGAWETEGAVDVLRRMRIAVRVVSDRDLERGQLAGVRILIVPNTRCMSRQACAQVARWTAAGGKLLATEMASYRDEKNRKVGEVNNFQWGDLYQADFQRWVNSWPRCEYLALEAGLAKEVAALLHRSEPLERIQLGRNQAMLVRARTGAKELATWLDADGKTPTTDAGSGSAAIVQTKPGVLYVGENLLAPELSRSPEVRALLLALLRRLDAEAVPTALPQGSLKTPTAFDFPDGAAVKVAASGSTIRVGITQKHESLALSSAGGLDLSTDNGATAHVPPRHVVEVRRDGSGLVVGELHAATLSISGGKHAPVQDLDLRPNGTCRAHVFRGTLEARRAGDQIGLVNVLSAEEYTAGVVPNEVPGSYPHEALKCMAVIARTFALQRHGFHASEGFDVCDTVHCQMYGGLLTEWDGTNRATNETAGEVVQYQGNLADSTFHAVCGGVGEDVEKVWPQPAEPYLVGSVDGPQPLGDLCDEQAFRKFIDHPPTAYCESSPRFRWTETYRASDLQALFEKSLPVTVGTAYHGLGTLLDVHVTIRSHKGRVIRLMIIGTIEAYQVDMDRIRWLWSGGRLGQGGLQSTLFYVDHTGTDFTFKGGGWGHGVGMCQDGAAGMATRGFDYHTIIEHYYPHTALARLGAMVLKR